MDDLDSRLIALLRADARLPVTSLARTLGVTRATVQARIDRLVARGDILGFTLRTGPGPGGDPRRRVRAVMLVEVEGERTASILKALRGLSEVETVHTTNGRWDMVLELGMDSLEAFDRALRRVRSIPGVANSETSLLLSTYQM